MTFKILHINERNDGIEGLPIFREDIEAAFDEIRAILPHLEKGEAVEVTHNGKRTIRLHCVERDR